MPYAQDISGCLGTAGGLASGDLDKMLARVSPSLDKLRGLHKDGSLPLLRLPAKRDDLPELKSIADEFRRRFSHVLVLGTGGSSLGGQTLAALADHGIKPRSGAPQLHFLDNIDPATFQALFAAIDLTRTGVVAISKSGSTAETMMQLATCVAVLRAALGTTAIGDRCVAITEPGDNVLGRLAGKLGMRRLDHDPGVGGRFSVISNVGLLPALIAGLDGAAIRSGAATVLDATLAATDPRQSDPALGAAISVALAEMRGASTTVLMPYVDRLAHFGLWFRQLWAESLGKEGKGTTPIRAMGTVDQHSQLQLYLDGPSDKLFTLVMLDVAGTGEPVGGEVGDEPALAYLAGRSMGDLLEAEQRATSDSLRHKGHPVRVFRLPRLDEVALGELLMHFMLETIIAADLLQVSAFDQPAVEDGKVRARQYLGEMTRSATR